MLVETRRDDQPGGDESQPARSRIRQLSLMACDGRLPEACRLAAEIAGNPETTIEELKLIQRWAETHGRTGLSRKLNDDLACIRNSAIASIEQKVGDQVTAQGRAEWLP